jgi:nucleoside-diphosphate-sugar epimerase
MRVAVTGASGRIGRFAVRELLRAGYDVRQVDRTHPGEGEAAFIQTDIRDLGQVCVALHGCDAVLHLAAIPTLTGQSAPEVFAVNVLGTFNVCEAAALLGIGRVAAISSASALGVAYRHRTVQLNYLPVDEDHPLVPQDAYGLSKQVGEDVLRALHRRTDAVTVSLRFPAVLDVVGQPEQVAALAADEQRALHTLWAYLDLRDAALACRLALEARGLSGEGLYVAAPEGLNAEPSAALAARHFPDAEVRADATGHWAMLDSQRAERLLGFRAERVYQS